MVADYVLQGVKVGFKATVNYMNERGTWSKASKVFRSDVCGGMRHAKAQAQEWESEQQSLIRRGTHADPTAAKMTVSAFWEEKYELILAGLRPNVRRNYLCAYRNDIAPTLGKVALRDLRASHMDVLKAAMRRKKMAPSTQNGSISAMSKILAYAVRDKLVERNFAAEPGVRVRMPKPKSHDRATVTPVEMEALAKEIDRNEPGLGDPVRIAFYTGVRAEELWALKARDIDLEARRITVDRAWIGTDETGRVLGPPKSGDGRIVPIFDPLEGVLRELVDGLAPDDWLFVGKRGNPIWHNGYRLNVDWVQLVNRQGHPGLRWHDLRHSCASWLIEIGISASVVQAVLGHSDLRVTQRYIHVANRSYDEAIRLVSNQ